MNEYQRGLEELKKELYSREMSRREFLASTTSKAAGLAVGAFLAGALTGYFLGRETEPRIITSIETTTNTEIRRTTFTTTLTVEKTTTKVETTTITVTAHEPYLDKISFIKKYGDNSLDVEASLRFNKRTRVKTASLCFVYPKEIEFPLREKDENFYIGKTSIPYSKNFDEPAPVDHVAMWNAISDKGVKASGTAVMKMPLRNEEFIKWRELANWIFGYILYMKEENPEETFNSVFNLIDRTLTTNNEKIRLFLDKYLICISKFNLQPFPTKSLVPLINTLQNLFRNHPDIFVNESSLLVKLNEPPEYLSKYYFFPYLISKVPDLVDYPFFAEAATLQSSRIIENYLPQMDLTVGSDKQIAFTVLDEVIIPRIDARIKWFKKGETVLPIDASIIDLMGNEAVALLRLADSIVSFVDFQFYAFRVRDTEGPSYPMKPTREPRKINSIEYYMRNVIFNTRLMLEGDSSISHSRVWNDIHTPDRINSYLKRNIFIPEPSHPLYELLKFWANVYVPFVKENGTIPDQISLIWFGYGPENLIKRPDGKYIHEEHRKSISTLAAESVGDTVDFIETTIPHRVVKHGDIAIRWSRKIWNVILNNPDKFLTPFYIEETGGIPNRFGIKEKWLESFEGQTVSRPELSWSSSIGNIYFIFKT